MVNVNSKIRKLLKALEIKGQVYLLNQEQVYSNKSGKVFNKHVLKKVIPVEEYNKMNPDKPKDPKKYKSVKVEVIDSFKKIDILLKLVEIYKEVGE